MIFQTGIRYARLRAALITAVLLCGCSMNFYEAMDGSPTANDIFPAPFGEKMIPLQEFPTYTYSHSEFDTSGNLLLQIDTMYMYFHDFFNTGGGGGSQPAAWSVEHRNSGWLIQYYEGARETSGIYIIGNFSGTAVTPAQDTVLWLPQFPELRDTWVSGEGAVMRYVSKDTAYWTPGNSGGDTRSAPWEGAFTGHGAYLLEETRGGIVTSWYVRKGIGILGYERRKNGKLIAAGTLISWEL